MAPSRSPPGDPQSSAVSIRGPRSPEDTGPLESPRLVQQAPALRPPSHLSWASSSWSVLRRVGAPPPRLPYSCQPPAVQVSFLEGQEGEHPAGSIPLLSRKQTALPAARGLPWGRQRGISRGGGYSATEAGRLRPTFSQAGSAWWGVGAGRSCLFLRHSKRSPLCPVGRDSRKPTPQPAVSDPAQAAAPQPRRQGAGKTAELETARSLQARPPGAKPCIAGWAGLRDPGMVGGSERCGASWDPGRQTGGLRPIPGLLL